MGQIWDRISRIAKSTFADNYSTTPVAERLLHSDDDELRRIIEELTKQKDNTEHTSTNSHQPPSDVMTIASAAAILGVSPDAPPDHIKSAYRKKLLEFHPDRVLTLSKEQQEIARERTIALNAAYQFLRQVRNF